MFFISRLFLMFFDILCVGFVKLVDWSHLINCQWVANIVLDLFTFFIFSLSLRKTDGFQIVSRFAMAGKCKICNILNKWEWKSGNIALLFLSTGNPNLWRYGSYRKYVNTKGQQKIFRYHYSTKEHIWKHNFPDHGLKSPVYEIAIQHCPCYV